MITKTHGKNREVGQTAITVLL